jgi:PAS domain S-box-containing protein
MPLSKGYLERLIEASPDIVVATDSADNTVAYYNDGARENLGYAREEIIGRPVEQLYPSLESAKRVKAAMRGTSEGGPGRVVNFPTTFVAKGGAEIPVAISGVILYDDDGNEQGTIGFAKDLREIIRKDQLAVLGEIAVGLSHEINNPLEAIANQLAMLERFVVSHAAREELDSEKAHLAAIKKEVHRIEDQLQRLNEMAEHEEYESTDYVAGARMIDLSRERRAPLDGKRILVVDDDEGVRESVAEILATEGCSVDTAEDGVDALQAIGERGDYDLVLSDVVMPNMDGYELFQAVQRRCPETQVVLMTAFYYDKDHIIKRSRMEGLEGVLFKKPIDPERLCATLAEVLTPPRPAPSSR